MTDGGATRRDLIALAAATPALSSGVAEASAQAAQVGSGVRATGVGAVTRSLADKLDERLSVLDFIPPELHGGIRRGDGRTDVARFLQAAIDAVIARGGGELHIPAGRYRCGAPLRIAQPSRCNLTGEGKDVSEIVRTDTRGPAIRLLNASSAHSGSGYHWRWEGIGIRFDPLAGVEDRNAWGVSFETGDGDPVFGHVNFLWRDVQFVSCNVAIGNGWGGGPPPVIWGWTWEGVAVQDFAERVFLLRNGGQGAFTNCRISSMYIQARRGMRYVAAPCVCDAMDGWTIDSLEWNLGSYACDALISAIGARALTIQSLRFEEVTLAAPYIALVFSQRPYTVIQNVSLQSMRVTDGIATLLRLGGETLGSIVSVQVDRVTGPGKLAPVLEGTPGNCVYLGQLSPAAGAWLGSSAGYASPRLEVAADGVHVKGKRVLAERQAAISDARPGQEAATLNAILSALRTHGLIES